MFDTNVMFNILLALTIFWTSINVIEVIEDTNLYSRNVWHEDGSDIPLENASPTVFTEKRLSFSLYR